MAAETDAKVEAESEADPQKRFLNAVAINPAPGIPLESGSEQLTVRAMDLITPIGMGQRGLIVAPPGSGKSTILKHICQAVGKAYPEIKLYALLIDERPKEVTDLIYVGSDPRAFALQNDMGSDPKKTGIFYHRCTF